MTKFAAFLALIPCALLGTAHSQNATGFQRATVVKVRKYELAATYIEDTAIGAPELPVVYKYDVELQLGCQVYTGRFESHTENLPSALQLRHTVDVRIVKHDLYVKAAGLPGEINMYIVGHRSTSKNGCTVSQ